MESVFAGEGHESDGGNLSGDDFVVPGPLDEQQVLRSPAATDRDDHSAATLELLHERGRYVAGCGGNDYGIKGRVLFPAEVTVAKPRGDIVVAELRKTDRRCPIQGLDNFNCVDVINQTGEDRRLVPGPGANLEDDIPWPRIDEIGHKSHDVRLRNRLSMPDGQRAIFVSERSLTRRNEFVAFNRGQGSQDDIAEPGTWQVAGQPAIGFYFCNQAGALFRVVIGLR